MVFVLVHNCNAQVIDFESVPNGNPVDGMTISTQFVATLGVSFSLEGGGFPVLAEVGAPRTAFQGYNLLPDNPAPGTNVGSFFLTDDGAVSGPPAPIIIDYSEPVAAASGEILDIDGTEGWQIQARDDSFTIIDFVDLLPNNNLDGSATTWSFNRVSSDIHSIHLIYTGANTSGVGLALDNFSPSTPAVPVILGDVNLDGAVIFLDIASFIALLSSGEFQTEADIDQNGEVDFLDIAPFIVILASQ